LALVHVSGTLVVIQERNLASENGQSERGIEFLMGGILTDIFFDGSNTQVDLFQGADPFDLIESKILDRSHESGFNSVQEDTRVLDTLVEGAGWDVADFHLLGDEL